MTMRVLVRPFEKGFKATVVGLADCTVEASTREAAIAQATKEAKEWYEKGEILDFEVSDEVIPRKKTLNDFIGMWKDDEQWDEFIEAMAENRRQMDADPTIP